MKKIILGLFPLACLFMSCQENKDRTNYSLVISTSTPERPTGQQDVLQLICDPIPTFRVTFIGLGIRGPGTRLPISSTVIG